MLFLYYLLRNYIDVFGNLCYNYNNKIMKREEKNLENTFLVLINKNIYCGKCGALLFDEEREINRHMKKCEANFISEAKPLDEIMGYSLKAKKDSLLLTINQASGNLEDFKGIIWEPVYTCEFFIENKKYIEQGTHDLKYWTEMLELHMLFDKAKSEESFNITGEPSFVTINKVFHGVGYVNSLSDFIKRFLTKGFKNKEFNPAELNKLKIQKIDLNIGKKYDKQKVHYCQLKEIEINKEILFSCCCVTGTVKNGKIEVEDKNYIIVSQNFVYNPDNFNISEFLNHNIIYKQFRSDKFEAKYPTVKFKEYSSSGGNKFLDFLLAENNDFLLEITGKAGLGYISNKIAYLNNLNKKATNVKDIFNLPIKALRNINSPEICDMLDSNTLHALKKAYELQPAIFNTKLTTTEITFLNSKLGFKGNTINACKTTAKDILDYCRYCKNLTNDEYILFVDYSNMCNNVNLWPYKKFPNKEDLKEAHDVIMHYISERRKATEAKNFEEAVNSERYFNLINIPTNSFYLESEYTILKPRTAQDLVEESYQMRNCVRSYVPAVASGRTYILFLRHKKSKSKSFVTIEINNNLELIQVKGKCNSHPSIEIRSWMKQYCKDKGISYSYCNDMKEPRYIWW